MKVENLTTAKPVSLLTVILVAAGTSLAVGYALNNFRALKPLQRAVS